jgi:hypothetical protein
VTVYGEVIATVQVRLSAETVAQPVHPVSIEPGGTSASSMTVAPFGAVLHGASGLATKPCRSAAGQLT